MTSQLNYLIVQQRHIELAHRAEQARLADEARAAVSASSPRWTMSAGSSRPRRLAGRQLGRSCAAQHNRRVAARVPEMRHMTARNALCASSAARAESLAAANGTRISLRQVGADDRAGIGRPVRPPHP